MPLQIAHLFYQIFLALYHAGIGIAAPFNNKAGDWLRGRKEIWGRINQLPPFHGKTIWMHCASLGEFEQGRPLLEKMRSEYPAARIVLTFFSPSGYNIRKNYPQADLVLYLPADHPKNARRFLDTIQPDLVVFIKYEFWNAFLNAIHQRNIPLYLVSAVFRENQPFFKWYGSLHRGMLRCFTSIFVQDTESAALLKEIGIASKVAYDLRFDRVKEIAMKPQVIPEVVSFCKNHRVIVAGSTWNHDERLLFSVFQQQLSKAGIRLIIAPHEVNEQHICQIETLFKGHCIRLSQAAENQVGSVLIIDSIGLLSSIYTHAWVSYIGGGFGKGIHNTLEAAVYGCPVVFGPNHQKFKEAIGLKDAGGGYCVHTADEFIQLIEKWENDSEAYALSGKMSREYVTSHTGGTEMIFQEIAQSLLAKS